MSSKTKTTATKEEAKPALVPKLRFPEFREEAGWAKRQLSEITTAIFDGTHQTPTYTDEGVPFYSVENLVSGNANKFISSADYEIATRKNKPEKGDVLITRIGKIGYSQVVTWSHDFSIYVTLAVIKKDGRFNSQFLHQSIQSAPYQKEIFSKSLLSAVPCKINMDSLRATHVLLASPAEQQKIAECLSSVDELMAAQARKLDALKTHKKGLMQQLLPRDGEALPSLRFPEFQRDGDWKVLPLAALAEKIMVGIASAAAHAYREIGVPMLRNQNIKEGRIDDSSLLFIDPIYEANHKNKRLRAGDVITVRTGYPGLSAVVTKPYEYAQCFTSLITRPKVNILDSDYLCLYINSPVGKQFMLGAEAGGAQKNVNAGTLETLEIHLPQLEEQRKIASSLSSLDALINAETQKLETLKTHKKGLMQQLFPAPEEAAA